MAAGEAGGSCVAIVAVDTPAAAKRGRKPKCAHLLATPTTDGRCQKARCCAMVARVGVLETELDNLRRNFDHRVEQAARAEVKAAEKKCADFERQLREIKEHQSFVMRARNASDRRAAAVAKEANESISKARRAAAVAKTELAQALKDLADETCRVRSLRRDLGKVRCAMTKNATAHATALATALAEATEERDEMLKAIEAEEQRANDAMAAARLAEGEAEEARQQAIEESQCTEDVAAERDSILYEVKKLEAKLARMRTRKENLLAPPPSAHLSSDELILLSKDAERQRRCRRRAWLRIAISNYDYDMADISAVVADMEKTAELMDAKEMLTEHLRRVRKMVQLIENDHLGQSLGLFLHFEMHLTLDKISRINAAGCMRYHRSSDNYSRVILAYNRFVKKDVVKMPRLAPPRCKLQPLITGIAEKLNIDLGENGRLARLSFDTVLQELVAQDPGTGDMPPLPFFLGGAHEFPIQISSDATGFGKQQFNTIIVRNPYLSKSANLNRFLGLGNCDDGRGGTTRLLGETNLNRINELFDAKRAGKLTDVPLPDFYKPARLKLAPLLTNDLSAVRHCEHVANSGLCGCSRETALRVIPKKPADKAEMRRALKEDCVSLTYAQRVNWSHTPPKGKDLPEPCTHPGCNFGKTFSLLPEEYKTMLCQEVELSSDDSSSGRAKFSRWRMTHAHAHSNVQPGVYGAPMYHHDFDDQILDPLHAAELGLPKTPWKHGVLNNASDDGREAISEKLAEFKHRLDCKRKENGRLRQDKWFTGAAWRTFCAGERGSPGGPRAIAALVMILAEDMQKHGVEVDAEGRKLPEEKQTSDAEVTAIARPAKKKKSGRANFMNRTQQNALSSSTVSTDLSRSSSAATAELAGAQRIPSAKELACDPQDLQAIRDVYGSRAQERFVTHNYVTFTARYIYCTSINLPSTLLQTLINILLAFDAYFSWYYPYRRSIPFDSPLETREDRAFDNMHLAIDLFEMYERLSINNHKSFLPHLTVYKVRSRQFLLLRLPHPNKILPCDTAVQMKHMLGLRTRRKF